MPPHPMMVQGFNGVFSILKSIARRGAPIINIEKNRQ